MSRMDDMSQGDYRAGPLTHTVQDNINRNACLILDPVNITCNLVSLPSQKRNLFKDLR